MYLLDLAVCTKIPWPLLFTLTNRGCTGLDIFGFNITDMSDTLFLYADDIQIFIPKPKFCLPVNLCECGACWVKGPFPDTTFTIGVFSDIHLSWDSDQSTCFLSLLT